MPLTSAGEITSAARSAGARGRGVGAFNLIQLEHAEAIVAGAEAAGLPVVLQISENCVRYHGALAPIGYAALAVARASSMPVAVHLDHATGADLVKEAVELGFGSVMFDGAALDYAANVAATADVVRWCHERDAWVEAELGEIGGKDGAHAPGVRTDPGEAAEFVAATGADALAVAVGSSHAMRTRDAALDFDLIKAIRETVPVPLVLHGSSGVAEDDLARAVDAGMTKINVGTYLNAVFTQVVRERLDADPRMVDTRKYFGPAREAVSAAVERLLTVLARAEASL